MDDVKKGDAILATPKGNYTDWQIYSAWVAEDNLVKIRFANYTDKPVTVTKDQYKITAVK